MNNNNQANPQPSALFRGQLTRMPFPHRASVAQAQMLPLFTDSDYEVFSQLTCTQRPVFLNVPEHYEILSELAAIASKTWENITIIARISMPGGMRIPVNLLADNVLLVEEVSLEEAQIRHSAQPVLIIDDRFSRIEIENNNNEIQLRLYLPDDNLTTSSHSSSLAPLTDYLTSINVQKVEEPMQEQGK